MHCFWGTPAAPAEPLALLRPVPRPGRDRPAGCGEGQGVAESAGGRAASKLTNQLSDLGPVQPHGYIHVHAQRVYMLHTETHTAHEHTQLTHMQAHVRVNTDTHVHTPHAYKHVSPHTHTHD